MTHYEERLERDLGVIRERIAEVGERIDKGLKAAVDSLLRLDVDLASRTILGDHPINRETREIDRLCHLFVARHLPGAGHLRYISSVLRLTVALERIGDYAVAIAREAVQLTQAAPSAVARDIEMMGDGAQRMLAQAMKAFHESSADLARGAKGMADHSKTTFAKVFADLLREGEKGSRPVADLFALLMVLNRLERVNDQAKNICEEAIFAATGETKAPKVYRVLFVDAQNSIRSVMAEAIARKGFPQSGEFASAGWAPADRVAPKVVDFLDRHGCDAREKTPAPLRTALESLNDYHVVVSLEGDLRPRLVDGVPYHTVVTRWDVGPEHEGELTDERLEELYKVIGAQVRDLMETLRGEQAS